MEGYIDIYISILLALKLYSVFQLQYYKYGAQEIEIVNRKAGVFAVYADLINRYQMSY